MMNVLEPRYDISLRVHFSGKIVPSMYEQEKFKVMAELSQASSVAQLQMGGPPGQRKAT